MKEISASALLIVAVALATVFGCTGTAEASAGATSSSQALGGALRQFVMHPGLAEANACVDVSSGPGRVITSRAARRGMLVVIAGSGFGDARGGGVVRFGAKKCTAYAAWNDTSITCRVPGTARIGRVDVTVTTASGVSNAKSLTVLGADARRPQQPMIGRG